MNNTLGTYKLHDYYYQANDSLKKIIDSEVVGKFVSENFPELEHPLKSELIIIISIRILGGLDDEILNQTVVRICSEDSDSVFSNIVSFIKPLVGEESNNINSEIAETEAQLEKVSSIPVPLPPIRTMDSDSKQVGYSSNEEATYTSAQSALINESK